MLQEQNNILQQVTNAIQNTNQWLLNFESCSIDDKILMGIIDVIKNAKTVAKTISINLKNNNIRNKGFTNLLNALKICLQNYADDQTINLTIDLTDNNLISSSYMSYIRSVSDEIKKKLVTGSITIGDNFVKVQKGQIISVSNSLHHSLDFVENNDEIANIQKDNSAPSNIITSNTMNQHDTLNSHEIIEKKESELANNVNSNPNTIDIQNDECSAYIITEQRSSDSDSMSSLPTIDNSQNAENNDIDFESINSKSKEKTISTTINKEPTPTTIEKMHSFMGYFNIGLTLTTMGINTARAVIFNRESDKVTFAVDILQISGIALTLYGYGIGIYTPWIGVGMQIAYNFYKKNDYEIKDVFLSIIPPTALMIMSPYLKEKIESQDTLMKTKKALILLEGLITLAHGYIVYQNSDDFYKEWQNKEEPKEQTTENTMFDFKNQTLSGVEPYQTL